MKNFLLWILLTLPMVFPLVGKNTELPGDFKRIEQRKYDSRYFTMVADAHVTKDGQMIGALGRREEGMFISAPDGLKVFNRFGEGPSELRGFEFITPYKGSLAVMDQPVIKRVKIFEKKDGQYVFKESKFFYSGMVSQLVRDGVYFKDKWFMAGMKFIGKDPSFLEKPIINAHLLRVFDDDGGLIKDLIDRSYKGLNNFSSMQMCLAVYKDDVYFVMENELKITVISGDDVKIKKEVPLEIPSFYKPMPPDFYINKKSHRGNYLSQQMDIENWVISYSSISKMVVEGDYLVIQVRTCDKKREKFALLIYDAETFKLLKTVFINDLLLGAGYGKYFFYANGHPGLDDGEADDFIINIYSFDQKSKSKKK